MGNVVVEKAQMGFLAIEAARTGKAVREATQASSLAIEAACTENAMERL